MHPRYFSGMNGTSGTRFTRIAAGLCVATALPWAVASCTVGDGPSSSQQAGSPEHPTTGAPSPPPAAPTAGSDIPVIGDSGGNLVRSMTCDGATCTLTIGEGNGTKVSGTRVFVAATDHGRAALRVGSQPVTVAAGDEFPVGGSTVVCRAVGEDSVTLTVPL